MWIIAIVMFFFYAGAAHAGPLDDCVQTQDLDRRIHGCTERIRQYPRDAGAFFNRAAAYLSRGDLDLAIADNTSVIQIDPAFAAAYYQRGIAYEGRAQHGDAVADLRKAIEINPRYGEAFDARARLYLKIGERNLALRDAESALSLDRFNERFLETRAQAFEALGRTRDAISDYERLLSGNPSMKSAIDGLRRLRATSPAVLEASNAAAARDSGVKMRHYAAQPRYSREEIECERARHADPSGVYAGYPCWARAALGSRRR